jgi:hypothetical protein
MKMKEATQILTALGWSVHIDEVGDKVAHFALSDRIVDIIYGIRKFSQNDQFEATLSASTSSFSVACMAIRGGGGSYTPLARAQKGLRVRASEILEEHVRQASEEAIAWAEAHDLDKALQDHAALPTSAPGARPVWHLAALALLGDVAKLRSYQSSFEAGDRLGFVNYVTKDYIDRAVALAEQTASG